MTAYRTHQLIAASFVVSFFFSTNLFAEVVRHVYDGDTIVLDNNERVRLIGVDAPEVENKKYGKEGEYYGEEARQFLKQLIEGKDVRLEDGYEPFDKYGRRLAYVYLGDLFVNAELVQLGYAEVFRAFDFESKDKFVELERQARSQGVGMWADGTEVSERTTDYEARGLSSGNLGAIAAGVLLLLFTAGLLMRRKSR